MNLSIIIPTYNRADVWRRGLLLDDLNAQTDREFDVLVADDGSTDDTCDELAKARARCQFPFRIFRCDHPKPRGPTDSLIPDNVLFRETRSQAVLHLDDDGFISCNTVAFAKRLMAWYGVAAYYGTVWFVEPETLAVIQEDFPTRKPSPDNPPIMPIDAGHATGAIWLSPIQPIRVIGGHDMADIGYRGVDSRLGHRLGRYALKQWFVNCPQFRFFHFGRTRFYGLSPDERMNAINQDWRVPWLNHTCPVIANGGESFFQKDRFPIRYVEL